MFGWFGPWPRRISYNWFRDGHWLRYSMWWADVPPFGLSIVADHGIQGQKAVVTSPRTEDDCRVYLLHHIFAASQRGMPDVGMTVDDWE